MFLRSNGFSKFSKVETVMKRILAWSFLLTISISLAGPKVLAQTPEEPTVPTDSVVTGVHWPANDAVSHCGACHTSDTFADETAGSWLTTYGDFRWDVGVGGLPVGRYVFANLDDAILRRHLQLGKQKAIVVVSSGESDEANLDTGDVILKISGAPVEDVVQFKAVIDETDKRVVRLSAIREGKPIEVELEKSEVQGKKKTYQIGVRVEEPSDALRSQLRLFANEGIIVTEVVEDSPAQQAEIEKHDILLKAADERLTSLADLRSIVQKAEQTPVKLLVLRGGKELDIDVTPTVEKDTDQSAYCPRLAPFVDAMTNVHDGDFSGVYLGLPWKESKD